MFAFKSALAAVLSIFSLALALKPLEVAPSFSTLTTSFTSSNATAANSCPTVTSTVRPYECFRNLEACPQFVAFETKTVPCGCPASAATTTLTACPGCDNVRWKTVTASGC